MKSIEVVFQDIMQQKAAGVPLLWHIVPGGGKETIAVVTNLKECKTRITNGNHDGQAESYEDEATALLGHTHWLSELSWQEHFKHLDKDVRVSFTHAQILLALALLITWSPPIGKLDIVLGSLMVIMEVALLYMYFVSFRKHKAIRPVRLYREMFSEPKEDKEKKNV